MASNKLNPDEITAIQDIILDFILSNGWKDYNNFARMLTENLLNRDSTENEVLSSAILVFSHPFYSFNVISKIEFLKRFPMNAVIYRLRNFPKKQELAKVNVLVSLSSPASKAISIISINEIFPEINTIDVATGKCLAESSLDIYERVIQNALRFS